MALGGCCYWRQQILREKILQETEVQQTNATLPARQRKGASLFIQREELRASCKWSTCGRSRSVMPCKTQTRSIQTRVHSRHRLGHARDAATEAFAAWLLMRREKRTPKTLLILSSRHNRVVQSVVVVSQGLVLYVTQKPIVRLAQKQSWPETSKQSNHTNSKTLKIKTVRELNSDLGGG